MTRSHKRIILILLDTFSISLALYVSREFLKLILSLDNRELLLSALIINLAYLLVAMRFKVFSIINRFTDLDTLFKIGGALLAAYLSSGVILFFILKQFSFRLMIIAVLLSFVFLISYRLTWRVLNDAKPKKHQNTKKKRTLVIGAGAGGSLFVSTVKRENTDLDILGIIDKDTSKKGSVLHGVKVLGNRFDIPRLVQELAIEQVTIAIPSLPAKEKEQILDICQSVGVPVNVMPDIEDVILGKVSSHQLKDIEITDLLGRQEVVLNQEELIPAFSGKTVLVTGAGGSIGSELCRQLARLTPKTLVLLGHGENSIYLIHRELAEKYGKTITLVPLIADIQDRSRLFDVMARHKPDIVYHAAAHKHVPLMEANPYEAVKNNVFGTKYVAEAAKAAEVGTFVMVSTDKAVNPPNVMGATKRLAEMIVTGLNGLGKTKFVAVRFGNVLGSRGSVVPVFKEQIAKGGPVTVTDFRMTRYFMTIPEASRLVIQAGQLAKGGEVFVLDMGEPVHILDLAKKVIKLSGHTEEEIAIVESGIRPGEKLYEELLSSAERVDQQIHEKIFVGKVASKSPEEVSNFIANLPMMTEEELKIQLLAFAKQD